jgi:toxin ParE1/3/4
MPYELRVKAADDLDEIYEFGSESFGIRQADRFFGDLKEALEFIGENPRLCHVRKEHGDSIRIHVLQSHLIIYTILGEAALILRIVHGHYDWQSDYSEH